MRKLSIIAILSLVILLSGCSQKTTPPPLTSDYQPKFTTENSKKEDENSSSESSANKENGLLDYTIGRLKFQYPDNGYEPEYSKDENGEQYVFDQKRTFLIARYNIGESRGAQNTEERLKENRALLEETFTSFNVEHESYETYKNIFNVEFYKTDGKAVHATYGNVYFQILQKSIFGDSYIFLVATPESELSTLYKNFPDIITFLTMEDLYPSGQRITADNYEALAPQFIDSVNADIQNYAYNDLVQAEHECLCELTVKDCTLTSATILTTPEDSALMSTRNMLIFEFAVTADYNINDNLFKRSENDTVYYHTLVYWDPVLVDGKLVGDDYIYDKGYSPKSHATSGIDTIEMTNGENLGMPLKPNFGYDKEGAWRQDYDLVRFIDQCKLEETTFE